MADPDIVEIACARAWGVYLLINRGIDENDAWRNKLKRFISECWEAGAFWRSKASNISRSWTGPRPARRIPPRAGEPMAYSGKKGNWRQPR